MLEIRLSSGISVFITGALAFLVALLFSRRRGRSALSTRSTDPPPLVDPAVVPDAGNVRDNWLTRRARYGNVHRVVEPHGVTVTHVGDVLAIKDIIDQSECFDMGPLHIAAAPMWHMSHKSGVWFAHTGGQATVKHSSHLLSGSRLSSLQKRFVQATARQLDAIQPGSQPDLCILASECFFQATLEALFTKTFPNGQYQEFRIWDAELNHFCQACPSDRAVQARNHFFNSVLQQIDEHLSECSLQVREQINELQSKYGLSHHDAVAVVLRTAWLGSTQSPLSGAWLLCILARQPDKVTRIRDEVEALKTKLGVHVDEIAANPEMLKGDRLPLLDNMVNELLRVYSAQNVPRVCIKDTVVRKLGENNRVNEMLFRQGDFVQLLFWNVHDGGINPQWWPQDQGKGVKYRGALEMFDETRFEPHRRVGPIKWGTDTLRTWTPFGFGARICPGRYWAVAEIKAFCLLFLDRFDLSSAGEMPRPDPQRWVGVLHQQDPMPVTLSKRN